MSRMSVIRWLMHDGPELIQLYHGDKVAFVSFEPHVEGYIIIPIICSFLLRRLCIAFFRHETYIDSPWKEHT